MGTTANNGSKKDKKSMKMVIVIIIILCLLVVIGVLGAVIYNLSQKEDADTEVVSNGVPSGPNRNTVVTMDNKDEILNDLANKVSGGMFEAKMNTEWYFEDSTTPSKNAYVANVLTNSNTIYFDVIDDATGKVIYESPYIPVGSALSNIQLAEKLAAGKYECTLTYHLIDKDYADVSRTSVGVEITIYK